jgi:hypothetical protein
LIAGLKSRYDLDYLAKQFKEGTAHRRVGRPSLSAGDKFSKQHEFFNAVLEEAQRMSPGLRPTFRDGKIIDEQRDQINAAIKTIANERRPVVDLETAKRYFREGQLDWAKFMNYVKSLRKAV